MDEENIMHTYLPGVKHPQLLSPCSPIFFNKSVVSDISNLICLRCLANYQMQTVRCNSTSHRDYNDAAV